jgi:acetylornithine deacetylase
MRDELTDLARELVAIDSVNPGLAPGAAGEEEISRFVAAWLERHGLEVKRDEIAPGRWNVTAFAHGSGGGRSLLLNGHLDTVGHAGMEHALEPAVEGNRLYGRGAYDMKTSVAAAMLAGARAVELGLRGDVIVSAVADEEVASIGSQAVAAVLRPDAAIVTEPTEERVAIAHKGFVWLEVETRGVAAHGSRADLGVDAIAKMGTMLVGMAALDRSLRGSPTHLLLGSGSLHASLVEGGVELSTYPDRCLVQAERRTIPGETPAIVEEQIREIVEDSGDPDLDVDVRVTFVREPFEIAPTAEIVELVRRHSGSEVAGAPYWADAAIFSAAGIPTVMYGPVGEGAHADVEWVDLDSATRCAETYLAVATEFCA